LYSDDSTLPRSLVAVSQRDSSKDLTAFKGLEGFLRGAFLAIAIGDRLRHPS